MSLPGSKPCATRLPGVMTCSLVRNNNSSGGSPPLPAAAPWGGGRAVYGPWGAAGRPLEWGGLAPGQELAAANGTGGGAAPADAGDDPRVRAGGARREWGDGQHPACPCSLLPGVGGGCGGGDRGSQARR